MKQLLLEDMQSNLYSCYTDEKSDVTSIPINKEVGAHLSAVNIMSALENLLVKNEINLQQACFACMDTTNINSGEKNGLKRHLDHKVPLLKWIGCNNHKLALTFKHLIPSFQCIVEIDIFFESLGIF